MNDNLDDSLVLKAVQIMQSAHCPYSKFSVGCALQTDNGEIILGCNIENASFSVSICAERVALFKAVSEGHTKFAKMVVACNGADFPFPCGVCRQALSEFCCDLPMILVNGKGESLHTNLNDLLPFPFTLKIK